MQESGIHSHRQLNKKEDPVVEVAPRNREPYHGNGKKRWVFLVRPQTMSFPFFQSLS